VINISNFLEEIYYEVLEDDKYKKSDEKWQLGKEYWLGVYFDKMWELMPNVSDSPYGEGKYCTTEQFAKLIYNDFNTKVVLYGKYIKIYRYGYWEQAKKYDDKTFKTIKYYPDNTSNPREKYKVLALANRDVFKTFITLTFKIDPSLDELRKACKNWLKSVRRVHKGIKYIRVIERGTKGTKRLHVHLLTSLDINVDTTLFVKSDTDEENQYNLTNWDYGWTLASEVYTDEDLTKMTNYISEDPDVREFPGMRKFSTSKKNLIQPRVFYFDGRVDQKKIDVLTKGSVAIDYDWYLGCWSTFTKTTTFKRDPTATLGGETYVARAMPEIRERVALYVRLDADDSEEEAFEKQLEDLEKYCWWKVYIVHSNVYYAEGFGKDDPVQLKIMFDDLKKNNINKVILLEPIFLTSQLKKAFEANEIEVEFVKGGSNL